jgi:hypothetical protein
MPDRACRLASLVRYSRAKYPWMNSVGTAESVGSVETAAAVVDATPEYSMRGYYTFGEKQERAALDAVLRARHAVIETVMMCLAASSVSVSSGPVSTVSVSTGPVSTGPVSSGPVSSGPMTLARELRSIPSQIMAIVAAAAMRL